MAEESRLIPPRESFAFEGGEAADRSFLTAFQRDRLHHAWLLCGPQGLGKASFAFRCARFLMGHNRDESFGALGMARDDADVRLITAQSHPDLLVLEREMGDTKLKKNISVDAVREVGEFFSKAPSRSAFRVCIIDSVDDLNINSANALLKILEEPPHKGIIFLISHSPGKLLATIRSRCRRLNFPPWSDTEVNAFLRHRIDLEDEAVDRLVRLAHGAPGRALSLMQEGALEMDSLAGRMLKTARPPRQELMAAAALFKSSSAKNDGARKFATFIMCLCDRLQDRALGAETSQKGQSVAKLWSRLQNAPAEAESVNLDRGDYFWSIYNDLSTLS
ncbi:DNA polymerase III, delta' subunit [Asticcacaulis biprosthecium C19]|uniref:DNA polymerase III, delta' subunit n=1 Tax=Asticcacaulis biprosthecium C19 TaxID=715226 RepID=F4QQT5_9CAUL|nr:DNA polymerase III subunit delta' [Asticcacaulis biprosthecium]EGF90572.1 DNA polymerase III, delta' subunit [Asticcacaulis biprosthecium C19]